MRTTTLAVLLFCLHLTQVAAQTVFYSSGSSPTSTLQTRLEPFGSTGTDSRIGQFVVSRYQFANFPVLITSMAFALQGGNAYHYQRLTVQFGYTTLESLDNRFAQNRPAALTPVLDIQNHTWPVLGDEWNDIGLQTPFLYVPAAGNLFVEYQVIAATASSASNNPLFYVGFGNYSNSQHAFQQYPGGTPPLTGSTYGTVPRIRFGQDLAVAGWFGASCPGSGGHSPALGLQGTGQLGTTTNFILSNARPQNFGLLAFGMGAALPQPQDLAPFGMTGCVRYINVDNSFGVVTSALGIASYPLMIPSNTALTGTLLSGQYFVLDPGANPAGVTATNHARVLAGL